MGTPIERHQLVFLNPDLSGLFAAYLSHRAGAGVAIVDELGRWRGVDRDRPAAFPAAGTFHPKDVDILATDASFPPPVWERFPLIELHLPGGRVTLNGDDGMGGMLIELARVFPRGKSVLTAWLQDQFKRMRELVAPDKEPRLTTLRRVETSVAEAITKLGLPEQDAALTLFDTLTILIVGRGIVQLDIRDFPPVLAGVLTGWHAPAPGEENWAEILAGRLQKEGARWHEVESVAAIQTFGRRNTVVRASDGTLFAAKILVVPENDRYRHPARRGSGTIIRWRTWHGTLREHPPGPPILGLVHADGNRPPINDNFIAYHLRPGERCEITLSAPVEERYLRGSDGRRLERLTNRIKFLLISRMGRRIESLSIPSLDALGETITLPGTSPSVSYPEGPLWGDDVLLRIMAADRLSQRILSRLE